MVERSVWWVTRSPATTHPQGNLRGDFLVPFGTALFNTTALFANKNLPGAYGIFDSALTNGLGGESDEKERVVWLLDVDPGPYPDRKTAGEAWTKRDPEPDDLIFMAKALDSVSGLQYQKLHCTTRSHRSISP